MTLMPGDPDACPSCFLQFSPITCRRVCHRVAAERVRKAQEPDHTDRVPIAVFGFPERRRGDSNPRHRDMGDYESGAVTLG
jgi:hypothetical protein